MTDSGSAEDRLLDLIIKRLLEGVDLDEARELGVLLDANPDIEADDLEAVVAALDAAPVGEDPPLPASIAELVSQKLSPNVATLSPPEPGGRAGSNHVPWLACAAAILVALAGWWQVLSVDPSVAPRTASVPVVNASKASAEPRNERELIDADAAAVSVAWAPPAQPDGQVVGGAIHWSGTHQKGYMELDGLAVNDPNVEQYQLWIFDRTRSQDHPVDGGVFDIEAVGMQRVPIRASLQVREATLFAVTVEAPGGVMVSDRQRIVALAQVAAN